MKKILSLLTILTLTASSTTAVNACSKEQHKPTKEAQLLNALNGLNKTFNLSYNSKLELKENKQEIVNLIYNNLKNKLKDFKNEQEVYNLIQSMTSDLGNHHLLIPDGKTLNPIHFKLFNGQKKVESKAINFIMAAPQKISNAEDLAKAINTIKDTLSLEYNKDLSAQNNINTIKNILNSRLSYVSETQMKWIKTITPSSPNFVPDDKTIDKIKFNITDDQGKTATSNGVNFIMKKSGVTPSAKTAAEIVAKIKNKNLWIKTSLGGNTSNQNVQKNILSILKMINSNNRVDNSKNLSDADIGTITFKSNNITLNNTLQTINLEVNLKGTTADTSIKVGLNPVTKEKEYAPFFDMGQINKFNLTKIRSSHGINTIIAAFLQHDASKDKPTHEDPVGWSWAGQTIDHNPTTYAQYQFLNKFRNNGGKFIISFGGANGTPGWDSKYKFSVNQLTTSFQYIINTYKPKGFDFDIEGSQQSDTAGNINLFKSMENIHKSNPNLSISYTIAVDPITDKKILNPNFEKSFTALLNTNFKPIINSMAMDFATKVDDMSVPIINSLKGIAERLTKEANTAWDVSNIANAYKMLGVTPMLGMNDSGGEISDFNVMMKVAHFTSVNKLPLFSNWSLTRDNGSGPNKGGFSASGMYQTPYEFSDLILSTYGDYNENINPVSGTLNLENYAFFKDAIAVKFQGVSNVNSFAIYLDDKKISNANASSQGFAYDDAKMTIGIHKIKVIAYGAQGSSVLSNELTFDNSQDKILKRPVINFDINSVYKNAGDLIYYKNKIVKTKWWKNAGTDFEPGSYTVLGNLNDFSGLSNSFKDNFTNQQIPSWYFHTPPQDM